MFSSVSNWFGVVNNKEEEEKENAINEESKEKIIPSAESEQTKDSKPKSDNSSETGGGQEEKKEEEEDSLEKTLEDASAAAINTAKQWGSKSTSNLTHQDYSISPQPQIIHEYQLLGNGRRGPNCLFQLVPHTIIYFVGGGGGVIVNC